MPSYQQARREMVERQLRGRGIRDPLVLQAFLTVPRHEFVPAESREAAYEDGPLPIGENQTISQPYMVASMTQALQVRPGDKVLEIGTGSGYQAAILAALGADVYSIERKAALAEAAAARLQALGYGGVHLRVGDGTAGWPEEAPFDRIIVTAGAPEIPQPIIDQLAEGGRLIMPVEEEVSHVIYMLTRTPEGLHRERGERCAFVPLIGDHAG